MTEDINYQALYEQLCTENEELRVRLTQKYLNRFDISGVLEVVKDILHNGYFWFGYFVAIIVMLFIGAFKLLREV